jgi:hypothetical protein
MINSNLTIHTTGKTSIFINKYPEKYHFKMNKVLKLNISTCRRNIKSKSKYVLLLQEFQKEIQKDSKISP